MWLKRQWSPDICTDGWFKGYVRLHWIYSAAKKQPDLCCNTLMHHINQHNLRRAFHGLDGSKASGSDRVQKSDYARSLNSQKVLKLKTSSKKLSRAITAFSDWIKEVRNRLPTAKIWKLASQKLRGHYNYFGVRFNASKIGQFYYNCLKALFKWFNRRSQKRSYTWEQFQQRLRFQPLPRPPYTLTLDLISVIDQFY